MVDTKPLAQFSWRSALDVLTSLAVIATAMVVVWRYAHDTQPLAPRRPALAVPSQPLRLGDATILGSVTAPKALIEFADFECSFCGKFAREVFPELKRLYIDTGQLLFAFKHLPLPNHKFAMRAAEAVECAGEQQQFWPMHERLFQGDGILAEEALRATADLVGLEPQMFIACLDSGRSVTKISGEVALATQLGVTGTPAFLLGTLANGEVIVSSVLTGARPLEEFKAAIEAGRR